MTQFKVGDRVRFVGKGGQGIGSIEGIPSRQGEEYVDVVWDGSDHSYGYRPRVLELVEEQPNRTYYGTSDEFAESVRKFATSQVSADDILKVRTLGEQLGIETFEKNVHRHLDKIADLLIAKNKAYGDAALNPIRAFSKASRIEQLNVRIDDKISRIQRGTDFEDEDTVRDLIGYLVLRLIAEESE